MTSQLTNTAREQYFLFMRGCREVMREFLRKAQVHFERLRLQYGKRLRLPAGIRHRIIIAKKFFQRHPRLKYSVYGIGSIVVLLLAFIMFIFTQTPSRQELTSIKNAVASEVYSADSVLLGRYFIQDRTEVKYEDISPHLIDALIATEDIRFHEHNGIDYRSLGRVLIKTILLQNESSGGGSTITQQLAKNLFPRKGYWVASMLVNKFREAMIATRMEEIYSKNEILAFYLNTIPFADNTYG